MGRVCPRGSTLQSNSDIGSFYSKIDNVAMEEVADLMAGEGLGVGRILLEVPRDDVAPMLALIRTLPGLDVAQGCPPGLGGSPDRSGVGVGRRGDLAS